MGGTALRLVGLPRMGVSFQIVGGKGLVLSRENVSHLLQADSLVGRLENDFTLRVKLDPGPAKKDPFKVGRYQQMLRQPLQGLPGEELK